VEPLMLKPPPMLKLLMLKLLLMLKPPLMLKLPVCKPLLMMRKLPPTLALRAPPQ
jgi:hypothetical protein